MRYQRTYTKPTQRAVDATRDLFRNAHNASNKVAGVTPKATTTRKVKWEEAGVQVRMEFP